MSKHAPSTLSTDTGTAGTLEAGLDAFQSSPEFHGPVEDPEDHQCNDHFAHIYETPAEKYEAAVPFVRHGLDRGERIMYVVDESTEAEVKAALRDGGIDVAAAIDSGALSFHTVQDTYLRNGTFDIDEMIDFYRETVATATDEYTALRIVAEMTWIPAADTSVEQFMEYEQKVNKLFAETESLAICQYSRDLFSPAAIQNVVCSHPHLIYDGAACHNFYYTPPVEFFADNAPARENDRMLNTLRDRTEAKAELQQREQFLRDLSETTADSTLSFEEMIRRLLELGCDRFNLDIGYFTRTTDDTFEIIEVVGDHDQLDPEVTDSLCDSYCEKLLASPGSLAVEDAAEAGWTDDPAYDTYGLDAYFATTVHVGGDEYGTLCFASDTPHDESFTDAEQAFLDLMGQWVGADLERRQREQFLRECYEVTADPARDFDEKLDALLDLGRERFGLDVGGLAKIDPETDYFEVETVSGDHDHLVPGAEYPLSETYCRLVTEDGETVAVSDPVAAGFDDQLCYKRFGVQTYLGTHVTVDGSTDRTFWFLSTESRTTPITDEEQTFVDLMGQWVEYELNRQQRERDLEQYETLAETATDIILTIDDEGRIRNVNPAVEETLGYAPADLVGEPLTTLMPDRFVDDHRAGFVEYLQTGTRNLEWNNIELPGVHADGTEIPLAISFSEYVYNGEHYFTGIIRDITERREREAELRQTKDRFETVFEQSDDGIFLLDPEADEFVDANPAAAAMTGYTQDELMSVAPSDLHPDELEQFHAFLEEARAQGSAWSEDLHCRHKNGHDIPAEITASPITLEGRDLMLMNVRHIEERKKHERYQRELYDITADPDKSFDEKLDALLELGRERFGLENGYFNHIDMDADEFEVVAAVGPHDMIEPGAVDSLTGTYCGVHLDTADPLAVADAADAELDDLRACHEYGLDAYFAATVYVDGEEYGTLCFASETPREHPFTDAERSFLDLMGQWISYEIERREHNQSQRKLYEITADITLDTEEKIEQLLALGCDRLDLPVGMLNRNTGDALETQQMHGDHPAVSAGACLPSTEHYCREVVNMDAPALVPDAAAAGWDDDPLYADAGLETYAGAPVTVDGQTYGTLCFADMTPRRRDFTDAERSFLDLMGQCIGYELDRREREDRLAALGTLGRDLLDTETPMAVADRAVDIIDAENQTTEAAIALYDDETGDLRLAAHTDGLTDYPVASLFTRGDGVGWEVFVSGDTHRVTAPFADTAADAEVMEVVVRPLGTYGVALFGATDPNGFSHGTVTTIDTAVTTLRAALTRADREQQLQDREQTLEEQNQTLTRLNRINDTIRSIDQALVEATTHDEVERVVCEELANVGPYELAWIGEHDEVTDEITPREAAGAEKGYLEASTITVDDAPEGCGPSGRAVKTGEPQFVNNVLTDESFEPWRQDALNRGYHATAAFPLTYNDTQYGVLNLYAEQPGVFDELEREVLTELSATIAHTLNAIETKKGLVSPTADELEFSVTDDNLEMLVISQEFDCAFELKRLVPRDDGRIRAFFAVDGATPDEVRGFTSRLPVEELRLVSKDSDDETCLFEAVLTEGSLGQTVVDHGGRLRSVEVEDGVASVVVRLGVDADTRTFVEMFKQKYPDSVMVANRTVQLSYKSALEFVETLDLTDRQREVLQTAFFSGYFEEPRNRTATEIADAMDIAQPTFNSHLRAAMRKLHRHLFEET